MPIVGIFFAKFMFITTVPMDILAQYYGETYFWDNTRLYAISLGFCALAAFFASFFQKFSFGTLGTNVTLKIRELLYAHILQKNLGWFDHRDNSSGVLTSTMASDTSLINGVSTESLGPQAEGMCALFGGLIIGFIYCW